MSVRKTPPPPGPGSALAKRARVDDEDADPSTMVMTVASSGEGQRKNALVRSVKRTSGLEAPIVSLTGAHGGGAEGCLIATDLTTGQRITRYSAHYGPLNSIAVTISGGRELVLTGGDDGIARVWDFSLEGKEPVAEFDDERDCPVTAVEWSKDGNQCFVGGVDNEVKVWDLRSRRVLYTLHGHTDTISSLSLSPSGHHLATFSLDSALIIYDVRPFSSDPMRVYRSLTGASAGFEQSLIRCCWSRHDGGTRVAAGGGDRTVTVWDVTEGKVVYKLPGHKGSVTGVDFHPREPIILTGSKDTNMLLGELDAQDYS